MDNIEHLKINENSANLERFEHLEHILKQKTNKQRQVTPNVTYTLDWGRMAHQRLQIQWCACHHMLKVLYV